MSDCRTSVGTVGLCRRAVGPATTRLLLSHGDSCIVHHTTLTQHSTYMHPWDQDTQCSVHTDAVQMLPSSCRFATMIAGSKPRCASQNLESHFSLLHSSLRQKYRVERSSEGSATSSLCILQVSEGECQGIKSSVIFWIDSATNERRSNLDDIVEAGYRQA